MNPTPNPTNKKLKLKKNSKPKLHYSLLLKKRNFDNYWPKLYFYNKIVILDLCDLTRKPLTFKL